MNITNVEAIPEAMHDKARAALATTFGAAPVNLVMPITGGASGASVFQLQVGGRDYVLRLEGARNAFRNPHQYTCMRIASEAGIAPPLRHADDANGVVIMDFVPQRQLSEYPGGPAGVAAALGALARRLQDTEPFPVLGDYRNFIARMLARLGTLCAPGLLDVHAEGFARIKNACPWDATLHVSSHNDPNPRNILFDGARIWLVDWETSYRNDKLVDIAVMAENLAASTELEVVLMQSWLGATPDTDMRARLMLVRLMTRLYYACLLSFLSLTPQTPLQDLSAPTPEQFKAMMVSGGLRPPEIARTMAKMLLASFRTGIEAPEVRAVLASYA